MSFDSDSVSAVPIRDQEAYDGMRVTLNASIGSANLRLRVDVGFGDAVVPEPEVTEVPSLLDFPPAELRTYPQETVVAEKLHGMVTFGIANSRMKDFYDVWFLSTRFPFDGTILTKAIASTFSRRKTDVPLEIPLALTDEFAHDDQKQAHWASFTDRTRIDTFESDLGSVIEQLRSFLRSPLKAVNMSSSFEKRWPPEGPWTTVE